MNQKTTDEEMIEAGHYEWAKKQIEKHFNVKEPPDFQIKKLGRVPWNAAIEWRDKNPSPAARVLVDAINKVKDCSVKPSKEFLDAICNLYEALAAYEESLK